MRILYSLERFSEDLDFSLLKKDPQFDIEKYFPYIESESKTLLFPITFNVKTIILPNLYVGKMHALLFRAWKNRVKGRDWFDFEWYVKKGVKLNLEHLGQRMIESGDLSGQPVSKEKFQELLNTKIDSLNIEQAVNEVRPFTKDQSVFDFLSREYFKLLASKIEFV